MIRPMQQVFIPIRYTLCTKCIFEDICVLFSSMLRQCFINFLKVLMFQEGLRTVYFVTLYIKDYLTYYMKMQVQYLYAQSLLYTCMYLHQQYTNNTQVMRAHNDVKKMYQYEYKLNDIYFFKKIYCMIMISPFKKSGVLFLCSTLFYIRSCSHHL